MNKSTFFSLNFRPCGSEKLELQIRSKMEARPLQVLLLLPAYQRASCRQVVAQQLIFQLSGLDEVENEHERSCLTWWQGEPKQGLDWIEKTW